SDSNFPTGPRFTWPGNGNVGFVGTNGVAVPPQFQQGAGFSSFPSCAAFSYIRDQQTRLNVHADGTRFANLGGRHTFKGGVQIDRLGNDVFNKEDGNRVTIRW